MSIKQKLQILYRYYCDTRAVGHTTLMKQGIDNFENKKIIIVPVLSAGTQIIKNSNDSIVSLHSLDKLRGNNAPLAIDNSAMYMILKESIDEIEKLESEIYKLKKALAIFTQDDKDEPQQLNS